MILKASMKLLQDQINQQLLGKIPENPQHQQAFVGLYDDVKGVTVANKGLHEYEILGDDTHGRNLLPCFRWARWLGLLPNARSSVLARYRSWVCSRMPSSGERFSAFRRAKAFQVPFTALQVAKQEGRVAATGSLFNHTALNLPQVCPTAFKVAENEEGYVLRYYNMSQENVRVSENNKPFLTYWNPISSSFRTIGTTREFVQNWSKKKKSNFKKIT